MGKTIIIFVVTLLARQIAQAQGTIYLSNLDETSTGSYAVGNDSWLAASFSTGGNIGGYIINSVQLAMANATGNPSGLRVLLYGTDGSPGGSTPGSSLATLNGSTDPLTAGIYSYIPVSSIVLSPHSDYYIVLTSDTTANDGAYQWGIENASRPSSHGWLGFGVLQSSDGKTPWNYLGMDMFPQIPYSQFAIVATPVPEPGILALFGLGGLFFVRRRITKAVC